MAELLNFSLVIILFSVAFVYSLPISEKSSSDSCNQTSNGTDATRENDTVGEQISFSENSNRDDLSPVQHEKQHTTHTRQPKPASSKPQRILKRRKRKKQLLKSKRNPLRSMARRRRKERMEKLKPQRNTKHWLIIRIQKFRTMAKKRGVRLRRNRLEAQRKIRQWLIREIQRVKSRAKRRLKEKLNGLKTQKEIRQWLFCKIQGVKALARKRVNEGLRRTKHEKPKRKGHRLIAVAGRRKKKRIIRLKNRRMRWKRLVIGTIRRLKAIVRQCTEIEKMKMKNQGGKWNRLIHTLRRLKAIVRQCKKKQTNRLKKRKPRSKWLELADRKKKPKGEAKVRR